MLCHCFQELLEHIETGNVEGVRGVLGRMRRWEYRGMEERLREVGVEVEGES